MYYTVITYTLWGLALSPGFCELFFIQNLGTRLVGLWSLALEVSVCSSSTPTLQCLSNTQPLTEYFTGPEGTYKKRINKGPPMGIAESYGEVLEQLWSGNNGCVAPRNLKVVGANRLQRQLHW